MAGPVADEVWQVGDLGGRQGEGIPRPSLSASVSRPGPSHRRGDDELAGVDAGRPVSRRWRACDSTEDGPGVVVK